MTKREKKLKAIEAVLRDNYSVVWHPLDDCRLTDAEYAELAEEILSAVETV